LVGTGGAARDLLRKRRFGPKGTEMRPWLKTSELLADRRKVKFGGLIENPCPKKAHSGSDRFSQMGSVYSPISNDWS
jgi:hypothetical protein